ncbi:MAG: chromate resistance protein [Acidobacteriia bacterium]|nr:chromate resistance protein [Terriglobia bacterium]
MTVTKSEKRTPWLLLVFSLPSARASQRVEVWRKLQRYGAMALRSSGYVLPNDPANQEKLEWLATAIRSYKGQASVVQVQAFDDLPDQRLRQLFLDARSRDYENLLRELKKILTLPHPRRPAGRLSRLRRQFQEIAALDFFENPLRSRVETLLARADEVDSPKAAAKAKASQYSGRAWVTRPRPGVDRVSSAWLIRRFIDPKARFVFSDDPSAHPAAIPFDMFAPQGFGHRGEDCTFETLRKEFAIRDAKVKRIAQIIHDADLGDEKFGRVEGRGLDQVLIGWAQQDVPDDELLRRGMELIEGLYYGLG